MALKNISLKELREQLYKKYSTIYLANELNITKNHFFKIINGKCGMKITQYNILIGLLNEVKNE